MWEIRGIAPPFLTSELDGGEWSASRSGRFPDEERAPGTKWIGNCVGPRAGLDAVGKKISLMPSPLLTELPQHFLIQGTIPENA
jgi:hypothetical protein